MSVIDPLPVLAEFGLPVHEHRLVFLGQAGGLSGALFWRIAAPDGDLCLRRWPAGYPSRERLEFIHAVLAHFGEAGISFVPLPRVGRSGATIIEHAGHFWELAPWLPGQADFDIRPSPERLQAAMRALAQIHVAAASFPASPGTIGPAPGIGERSEQLAAMTDRTLVDLARAIEPGDWPVAAERAQQIMHLAPRVLPRVVQLLQDTVNLNVALAPCLRDIWQENILFQDQRVTGIVDFGAVRLDNVATDVARLLGSMAADDLQRWQSGVAAYGAIKPISAAESRLIVAYDVSGAWLGGLNWVRWLYVEGRQFDDRARVERRLDHLLARLSCLANDHPLSVAALALHGQHVPDSGSPNGTSGLCV